MKKIRGCGGSKEKKKVTDTGLFPRFPFLSFQDPSGQKPHSKAQGNSLHYSVDPEYSRQSWHICAQWECPAVSSSLKPQQGECGQVAATWQGERECWVREFLYLLSPIQWVKRGIELPSGVWNRYICLRFASVRAAAIILKWCGQPKDIAYNMNETYSQSNEATFFFLSFFQQVDQKVSFP